MIVKQYHATEGYLIKTHSLRVAVVMIAERTHSTADEVLAALRLRGSIRTDGAPIPSLWRI